ncbi:hypothetical protein ccbrp13_09980 [Ktedonobacteria bacterium brp13]|nr:hypothetical protein ccbrp13_09980 [Ktedonobacteria bacterium brp13]
MFGEDPDHIKYEIAKAYEELRKKRKDRDKAKDNGKDKDTHKEPPRPVKEVNCTICNDALYLRYDVPVWHSNFGKTKFCACKEKELREQQKQYLLKLSCIGTTAQLINATFDSFNGLANGVQEALEAAQKFQSSKQNFLVLKGHNGCGKTHLAVATARQYLENDKTVLFQVVPDLLDHLRATFAPNSDTRYDKLFTMMKEVDLLILDDLGAQNPTAWTGEKLFQLINHRYNNLLDTIITTNLSLDDMENRISSRLRDSHYSRYVNMDHVDDYRYYASVDAD